MANNLLVNPVQIEVPMTSSYKGATAASLGTLTTLLIEKILWLTPTTIGDGALIDDPANGTEIARFRAEVAGQSQVLDWTSHPRLVSDFIVPQINSGRLKIYLR